MEVVQLLGSAMGLGFVSGLNLYATVLTLGLGIRLHLIILNPEFFKLEILGSWYVLVAAGILFLLETFADKIPWVDSLWDAVHTVIRTPQLGAMVFPNTTYITLTTTSLRTRSNHVSVVSLARALKVCVGRLATSKYVTTNFYL